MITFLHLEYQYIYVLQWKPRDFLTQLPALTVFETEIHQKSYQGNIYRNRNSIFALFVSLAVMYKILTYLSLKHFEVTTMFDKSLYNVVYATRALIGRCPWFIGVQTRTKDYTDVTAIFLFNMMRGLKESAKICGLRKWRTWKKLSSCIRYLFMPL